MDDLAKLKLLTGETDEALLTLVYDDATEYVMSYTNRTYVPDALKKCVRDLAVIAINRMGTEGESGRSEAGESYSFDDAPKHIYDVLNQYRLARCGGHAHEAKQNTDVSPKKP